MSPGWESTVSFMGPEVQPNGSFQLSLSLTPISELCGNRLFG